MFTNNNKGGVAFAASYLGYSVSSIYKMVKAGKLPVHRLPGGRRLFFFESDLESLLRAEENKNGGFKS